MVSENMCKLVKVREKTWLSLPSTWKSFCCSDFRSCLACITGVVENVDSCELCLKSAWPAGYPLNRNLYSMRVLLSRRGELAKLSTFSYLLSSDQHTSILPLSPVNKIGKKGVTFWFPGIKRPHTHQLSEKLPLQHEEHYVLLITEFGWSMGPRPVISPLIQLYNRYITAWRMIGAHICSACFYHIRDLQRIRRYWLLFLSLFDWLAL